MYDLQIDCV